MNEKKSSENMNEEYKNIASKVLGKKIKRISFLICDNSINDMKDSVNPIIYIEFEDDSKIEFSDGIDHINIETVEDEIMLSKNEKYRDDDIILNYE